MFRGHTSEWKSVSRRRARNSACNLTVFEGKYHCKYMNNNAFAQVRRPFFSVSPPNKNTPMRTCIGVPPQSSTRIRSGGGKRWRTCIKRWNVATLSPRRRGDTARPTQGDRRKPRERRHNPRSRRVGGTGKPQSSTRIRSGGGRRWRTCIKRWNVATLSPRRTQGDRRKPRERCHNPRRRRVGGAGKPQSSTRIRSGGGRRWRACIKRWNVATLSPRRRGDTARPISTQPEESAGRLPGWIKIPSRPGTCIRRGSRAPQAADHRRGERANRGETKSRRSGYSPAGMAGCAPEAGGSSVAMGDCPLSAGKNSTPSVPPGRWAVRRKRINVDI